MERIYLLTKYDSKTKNTFLPNARKSSAVNEPTSVGIEPVSSFEAIKMILEKIRQNKLEAKNEYVLFQSIIVEQKYIAYPKPGT